MARRRRIAMVADQTRPKEDVKVHPARVKSTQRFENRTTHGRGGHGGQIGHAAPTQGGGERDIRRVIVNEL